MSLFFTKFLYILGPQKTNFYRKIIFYSSSSILDLLVLSLLPFLIAIFSGSEVKNYFFFSESFLREYGTIYYVGCLILIITILKAYINYLSIFKIVSFVSNIQRYNREKIFSFYKDIFLNDFISSKFEKFLNTTSYIVGVFSENILFKLITIISEIIIILIISIYLSFVNFYALLGLFIFFFTLLFIYFLLIKKFITSAGKLQSDSLEKLTEVINNVFKGLKEIKIFNLSNFFDKKFNKYNNEYTENFIHYQKLVFLPKYLLESLIIVFIILLFFSLSAFSGNPISTYFELIGIFIFAGLRITPLAYNIFSSLSQIYSSKYSLDTIYEEFKRIDGYQDKIKNKVDTRKVNRIDKFHKLSLTNICFSYTKKKDDLILNNFNLTINKGECIGIKGDSGSGKTTFVNILLGLIYPDSGGILVNENIDAFSSNIYDKMSYTPQDSFLINGSILENIALGKSIENLELEKSKIFNILKTTRLDVSLNVNKENFMELLSVRKVDTLSGGQAQRVAICRNLYFNREINIFDEFTSSLDIKTEDKIVEFFNSMKGTNTIIIISHRINALKYCDRVFEVSNGGLNEIKKIEKLS